LEARVIVTSYNQHVRLLSLGPWLVSTTKVYSGVGADIVMESFQSKSPRSLRKGECREQAFLIEATILAACLVIALTAETTALP
jgi:hypothetical protein